MEKQYLKTNQMEWARIKAKKNKKWKMQKVLERKIFWAPRIYTDVNKNGEAQSKGKTRMDVKSKHEIQK